MSGDSTVLTGAGKAQKPIQLRPKPHESVSAQTILENEYCQPLSRCYMLNFNEN